MIKLGVIGINQGNGHPYSFSAIINGYDKNNFNRKDWDVIYQYLEKCHPEDFLNQQGIRVSHVFTQVLEESRKISQSTNIPNVARNIEELLENTDGIILAMDTWETHLEIAKPFLEADKYVFIDKPLSLKKEDLDFFLPYLKSSKLMSCSGMLFARELDDVRKKIKNNEEQIMFVEGSIGHQWDKYLIHLIDAILGITYFEIQSVNVLMANEQIFTCFVKTNHFVIQLNNRNADFVQPIKISITTNKDQYTYTLTDNFSAFRRMLGDFACMIFKKTTQYNYHTTIQGMKILQQIKEEIHNAKR